MVSDPPLPNVVISLESLLKPWNPATIAILPASKASATRPGVTSAIRALPCTSSVMIPACEPVKESDGAPKSLIAIDSKAIEIRSPEVKSISSSLPSGLADT